MRFLTGLSYAILALSAGFFAAALNWYSIAKGFARSNDELAIAATSASANHYLTWAVAMAFLGVIILNRVDSYRVNQQLEHLDNQRVTSPYSM